MFSLVFIDIHDIILDSIKSCDIDIQDNLSKNIILSGGKLLWLGLKKMLISLYFWVHHY